MTKHCRLHGLLLILAVVVGVAPQPAIAVQPPIVILKMDDFRPGGTLMPDGWQRTSDLLAQRQIKASYGMIGKDIARANSSFCDWVRRQHDSGMIEFWNHGYTHARRTVAGEEVAEFRESFDVQLKALTKTQDVGKQKLGFTFTAFGAPFNAINAETARALQASGELTIWLYGNTKAAKEGGFTGSVLVRQVDLEKPVHQPNFSAFRKRYDKGDLGPCIVLQGHPQSWASEKSRFENFVKIIDFLQQQDCAFMTPSQYVATLN